MICASCKKNNLPNNIPFGSFCEPCAPAEECRSCGTPSDSSNKDWSAKCTKCGDSRRRYAGRAA